jgi:deoxyribose-phosphate aldolase
MEKIGEQEISQIVDEVVRRITEGAGHSSLSSDAPDSCSCRHTGASGAKDHGEACSCTNCREDQAKISKVVLDKGACRISATNAPGAQCGDLAPFIDHTLLKANATESEVATLCAEAREYHFASVCVNTSYVETCARLLEGSGVKVCCVVGFPLGAMTSESKAFETRDAVSHGADEVDMVINVGKLQSGNYGYAYDDIRAVVKAAAGHTVKVIIETSLLTDDQKIAACVLAKAAGADFVKTSTGFGPGGATADDVSLMRRIVGEQMGVKASGGIRDCPTAQQMVESGATRIGASASVGIVKGQQSKSSY